MKKMTRTLIAVCALPVLLTACGGGGGGDGGSSASHYKLDQAFTQWFQQGQTAGLQGSGNCAGALVVTQGPAQSANGFAGAASAAQVSVSAMLQPECPYPSGVSTHTEYFNADTHLIGRVADGQYGVYTPVVDFPDEVRAGDSGNLATLALYTDASKSQSLGREEFSYAVTEDGEDARVTLTSRYIDAANVPGATVKHTFRLKADNTLSLIALDIDGLVFSR